MRIAYVVPYQGPALLNRRPILRNRSMSNKVKIELIAEFLHSHSHEVEIISQGEVIEHKLGFYPSFAEPESFHPQIPVYYASALPVQRLNGLWSNARTLSILKKRHRANPYDLVIVLNLKGPQLICANYAIRHLGLPVILEYEDDRFVNVVGEKAGGLLTRSRNRSCRKLFKLLSGCIAVSPRLLAQLPSDIPKLLLRGAVGDDIIRASNASRGAKQNWILFSGTHVKSNGVEELVEAWRGLDILDWELHITGYGDLTERLRKITADVPGIVFHGLVSRERLVDLMSSAKICINPHAVSQTPGNVFAFKIIEYMAAGAHVITTPMGPLETELEAGMTYMPDNSAATIAATIRQVIGERAYERSSAKAAHEGYGPAAVSESLNTLLHHVMAKTRATENTFTLRASRSRQGAPAGDESTR